MECRRGNVENSGFGGCIEWLGLYFLELSTESCPTGDGIGKRGNCGGYEIFMVPLNPRAELGRVSRKAKKIVLEGFDKPAPVRLWG